MLAKGLIVFALCLSSLANADSSDEFNNGFQKALETLAEIQVGTLGARKSGGTVALATSLADQIKYVEVPSLGKPQGATRRTAFAVCEKQTVFINREALTNKPIPLSIIIHESLSALCIADDNYEITSVLTLLIDAKQKGFRHYSEKRVLMDVSLELLNPGDQFQGRFIETLAEQSAIQKANSESYTGSGTYIGSGGDEISAEIKVRFLKRYLGWLNSDLYFFYERVRQAFFNIKIERVPSRNGKIRYVRIHDPKKSVRKEVFYFYVPEEMSEKQAAGEIFNFMTTRLGYGQNFRAKGYVPHVGG